MPPVLPTATLAPTMAKRISAITIPLSVQCGKPVVWARDEATAFLDLAAGSLSQ
jgi:hypothetical protein